MSTMCELRPQRFKKGRTIPNSTSAKTRERRPQATRTEETRAALIEAAVTVLNRSGYNSATTAAIADAAGISRGSIIYHFSTRSQLMSEVISFVYEQERHHYEELARQGFDMSRAEDWPDMLWKVLSRPSGMAVFEILQASRSDPELAALVIPTQERVEQASVEAILRWIPGDLEQTRVMVRLFVWTIRGLALSRVLSRDPGETEQAVHLFREMVRSFAQTGNHLPVGSEATIRGSKL